MIGIDPRAMSKVLSGINVINDDGIILGVR